MRIARALIGSLLLVGSTSWLASSAQAIDVAASASRTSGVAPLSVLFEAAVPQASAADSFIAASYQWDFGDLPCKASAQTWAVSGKSRCSDLGPVAGHVFETPGTYTVTVEARYLGGSASRSLTIQVADPEVVFSGTNTICVSTSGRFDDPLCDGARHETSSASLSSVLSSHLGSGKRVLLRRGESRSGGSHTFRGSVGTVGAYGTGNRPVINLGDDHMIKMSSGSRDLRVMDLEVQGNNSSGSIIYAKAEDIQKDLLFLRVDAVRVGYPFLMADVNDIYEQGDQIHSGVAIVDSKTLQRPGSNSLNDMYFGTKQLMLLGNQFGPAQGTEHTLRFPLLQRGVIAHNRIGGNVPDRKHVIKLHNVANGSPCSEEIVLSDNVIDAGGSSNVVDIGPKNAESPGECIQRLRLERNLFVFRGDTDRSFVRMRGRDMLAANNIFDMTAAGSSTPKAIVLDKRDGSQTTPITGNYILNNTCWVGSSKDRARCVEVQDEAFDNVVKNNILAAPNVPSNELYVVEDNGTRTIKAANQVLRSSPFVSSNPSAPSDFRLASSSSLIDAGSRPEIELLSDYTAEPGSRIRGNAVDLGAFESGSSGSTPAALKTPFLLP